ncbi:MAG: DUF5706 domain-containing protein [Cyclobacteriaceae bacterium]
MASSEKKELRDIARAHVVELFSKHLPSQCIFHNLNFTEEVVEVARTLSQKANFSDEETEDIEIAGWFFDASYLDQPSFDVSASMKRMHHFFKTEKLDQSRFEKISQILRDTNDRKFENEAAQILHDARISFLGRKRFFRLKELLQTERSALNKQDYDPVEWEELMYQYLTTNHFQTSIARKEYSSRRGKNIADQRKAIEKARKVFTRENTGKDLGRGIDTLYRNNYRTHINLSAIADGKANMMISINTIILSVIITLSGASFTFSGDFIVDHYRYTVPIFLLLLGAMTSVIFAILSARPKVTEKEIQDEKICNNKISLLYFGNFLDISMDEFLEHLRWLKTDETRLYDSMSIDTYHLGLVLKKKYKLLIISYNLFMIGLILSFISFTGIFIYTNF